MEQKKRHSFFDFLKGILILTVLGAHIHASLQFGTNPPQAHLWWVMGAWHMPLFMGIAGWFFWYSVGKRSFAKLIQNKVQTILIPAAVWCFLFKVVQFAVEGFSLSLFAISSLWFLWSILLCILLSAFCYHVGKRAGATAEYTMAAGIGIGLYFIPQEAFNVAYMFPFFYGGYLANRLNLAEHFTTGRCAALLAAAGGMWAFSTYTGHGGDWSVWTSHTYLFGPDGWRHHLSMNLYRLWLGFAGAVGFTGVLHAVYTRYASFFERDHALTRFMRAAGVYSLSIYAMQSILVEQILHFGSCWVLIRLPQHPLHDQPILYAWIVVPFIALCAAGFCLGCTRQLLRFPRLAKIFIGK